ncbi:MAG: hypothetical protein ACFFD4_09395 [Candidatus Odinarchaeota archaeon]
MRTAEIFIRKLNDENVNGRITVARSLRGLGDTKWNIFCLHMVVENSYVSYSRTSTVIIVEQNK